MVNRRSSHSAQRCGSGARPQAGNQATRRCAGFCERRLALGVVGPGQLRFGQPDQPGAQGEADHGQQQLQPGLALHQQERQANRACHAGEGNPFYPARHGAFALPGVDHRAKQAVAEQPAVYARR